MSRLIAVFFSLQVDENKPDGEVSGEETKADGTGAVDEGEFLCPLRRFAPTHVVQGNDMRFVEKPKLFSWTKDREMVDLVCFRICDDCEV